MPCWNRAANLKQCLVALVLTLFLGATLPAHARPFWRDWWLTETNTPIRVNDLLVAPGGYLWLASAQGIYRFNGTSFYLLPETRGQEATAFCKIADGLLCAFRSGKIVRLSGDRVYPVAYGGQQAGAAVSYLSHPAPFTVFGTLGEGAWLLLNHLSLKLNASHGLRDDYVYGLQALPGMGMLAATDRGIDLLRFTNDSIQNQVLIPEGIMQVLKPKAGQPGIFLAGSREGLWYEINLPSAAEQPQIRSYRVSDGVVDMVVVQENLLVFTENSRAYCYRSTAEGYRLTDSFDTGPRTIHKACADANGNIWLATSEGLSLCTYAYLRQHPLPRPFALSGMAALFAAQGTIWYSQEEMLHSYDPVRQQAFPEIRLPAPITALAADEQRIYAGTLGEGLHTVFPETQKAILAPGASSFHQDHILDLDYRDNCLWMATLNGVEELQVTPERVNAVRHHAKKTGLPADYVYQVLSDSNDVWFATDGGGICRYDGSQYERFEPGTTVYSLALDANKKLWAVTLEKGLLYYANGKVHPIGDSQGLQSRRASAIAPLGNGNLVIVHDQGVDVWIETLRQFRHINRRSGLGIDSQAAALNCIATDAAGDVWLPYEDGLLQFVSGSRQHTMQPPGLILQKVSFPGIDTPVLRTRLKPDENSLSFQYEGINLLDAERLAYRYLLEGLTDDWVYTRDEEITFSGLAPGRYRFLIEASYSPSFENAARRGYAFSIAAPLWRQGWFIGLMLAALLGLALFIIRLRERNIRKLALLQNARLEAEYQHLRTQVNPHFLFNSLNILTTLIRRDADRALQYTLALSDLYRNTLHYSNTDRIPLSEEWDLLQQYLLIQQTRFGDSLQIESDVPEEVFTKHFIVPLTLQMLIENAIKHTVFSAAQPLVISLSVEGHSLVVRNPHRHRPKPEKGAGIGLTNIQSRYRMLGADIAYGRVENNFVVQIPLL